MTNTTEHSKRPTHRVYAVRKISDEKSYWTVIGVAWANQDGKGFNLKLSLLPLDGSDIVVREPRTEELRNQTVFAEPQDVA
jgi:hypothetical protein